VLLNKALLYEFVRQFVEVLLVITKKGSTGLGIQHYWQSACLACTGYCVQFPALPKKKKRKNYRLKEF
jgi:hypothetical protein